MLEVNMQMHSQLAALLPLEPSHQQGALVSSQEQLQELNRSLQQLIKGATLKEDDGSTNM